LRLRLWLPQPQQAGTLMQALQELLHQPETQGLCHKLQLDTYAREIERYGASSMELCEAIFAHDSQNIAGFLSQLAEEAPEEPDTLRWLYGLRCVDQLLAALGFDLPAKKAFANQCRQQFAMEFGNTKDLKQAIGQRHRAYGSAIELAFKDQLPTPESQQLMQHWLQERAQWLPGLAQALQNMQQQGQIAVSYHELIWALVHMHFNRLLRSKARVHEMVLHEFLYRYYSKAQATQK